MTVRTGARPVPATRSTPFVWQGRRWHEDCTTGADMPRLIVERWIAERMGRRIRALTACEFWPSGRSDMKWLVQYGSNRVHAAIIKYRAVIVAHACVQFRPPVHNICAGGGRDPGLPARTTVATTHAKHICAPEDASACAGAFQGPRPWRRAPLAAEEGGPHRLVGSLKDALWSEPSGGARPNNRCAPLPSSAQLSGRARGAWNAAAQG